MHALQKTLSIIKWLPTEITLTTLSFLTSACFCHESHATIPYTEDKQQYTCSGTLLLEDQGSGLSVLPVVLREVPLCPYYVSVSLPWI